ncbi:hypothetical protein AVEN_127412-1 [Araneus ventricosus]|uniref:Uncharacterized protein n=1 Tax=Araneus ventricosus TaxID=182803 RepID=A0A4Y2I2P6_ARAVE|nr:hypothetical protein AVEN_127412-1 [Araneus ventricosus]
MQADPLFSLYPRREVPMQADPLFSLYPRIEVPNWNRRMEFWILSSLEFHHFRSICSKFHRIKQIIHGCSKVCLETRFKVSEFLLPLLLIPPQGGFRVSFLTSKRGPNAGRSFVVPLPSHRGPKLESSDGVLDFEYFGIPPLPIHLLQISSDFTDEKFSFLCSKNSRLERR